jgi:polysaccharide pyruvyl transferase WcaK-like protein
LWETWKTLRGVRVLIFGGGTLFHAAGGSPTNLLILASVVVLARLRGARVGALGVGVGEISGTIPHALLATILRLAEDFAVRDQSSLENCQGLGGSAKVRLTADLVFLYPLPVLPPASRPRPVVGLALAASAIGSKASPRLASVSGLVDLLDQSGWEVFGLSFQELEFEGFRLSDSALLQSMSGNRPAIPVRRLEASGDGIAEVFNALDVVVGMRFHALVLAARLGIPFVGIGYDAKLADLCRRYGFPFFELDSLRPENLMAAVEQVRGTIPDERVTEELMQAAATNFERFGSFFCP